tara:strand:+ start:504 stop:1535 length:1032 start_codon:yes stop_codon:yes gene_type:complete
MSKEKEGNFFEDYKIGMQFNHATPRTLGSGERAMYQTLYLNRYSIFSSDLFANECGYLKSPHDNLIVFHTVFGKTVADISLNAVANLAYYQGRFFNPVYDGDTLRANSKIIGLKQNSNGKTGLVYVKTSGYNQKDKLVLEYTRCVMVKKNNLNIPPPKTLIPDLDKVVNPKTFYIFDKLNFSNYKFELSGSKNRFSDYEVGEHIFHVDAVTIEEAEHMMATRLWQNNSKVHFDKTIREDKRRLIYGGHLISLGRALSFNGLENAQIITAINGGTHVNPTFAGDTIFAKSEIIDKFEEISDNCGALRVLLTVAKKSIDNSFNIYDQIPEELVVLKFDYWALIPK